MSEHDTPQEGAPRRGPGRPRKPDPTETALTQLAAELAALAGRVAAIEANPAVKPAGPPATVYCDDCGSRLPMHFDDCPHYQAPTQPED